MLISSWLKSFSNRLKTRRRRPNRVAASHRRAGVALEDLEARTLLTGPELIAVSPNVGQFIVQDTELTERPQELTFQFSPGQVLDASTLNAIQITGSGFDDSFTDGNERPQTPGFIGLGDTPDTVVFRFSSPLQDDRYEVSITGTGSAPLQNNLGEAFLDGADQSFEFDLNLGATIRAIVPQPVVRSQELSVLDVSQFSDGDTITIHDGSGELVFEFEDTAGATGSTSDVEVQFNSTTDTDVDVANALLAAIGGATFPGDGVTVAATAPTTLTITGNSLDATVRFTTANSGALSTVAGGITQHEDRVIVYFNPDTLDQGSAETQSFYQLIDTMGTVAIGDDAVVLNPDSVRYDPINNLAVLMFPGDIATGTYRLRIGTDTAQTSFVVDPTVWNDDDSSFATANILGALDAAGVRLDAAIEPQSIALPSYPGGSDEPGHRQDPTEDHGAGSGVFSTAPNAIRVIAYYFPEIYAQNLQNQDLLNEITDNQKERTREIFEMYAGLYGFETIELEQTLDNSPATPAGLNPDQTIAIITGNLAITGIPPLAAAGVANSSTVIISGATNHGVSPFGGGWFNVALHEVGHAIGLGHSYDIPSVQGNGPATEDQYPGNHDIVHGQRIHRPDANDIDLYSFSVAQPGTFTAEVIAERLVDGAGNGDPSLLNSVLRLYRETPSGRELVAQNDDYFSNDSFLELDLEAGNYFIGVSSTGNNDYDPTISDTGYGGLTDGKYDLRLRVVPTTGSQIIDEDGVALDGDDDGAPGGVFDFHFRSDNTLFVDKANDTTLGDEGTGTAADPYDSIDQAVNAATAGDIIRIVANAGSDNDLSTIADNRPYLIGLDDNSLPLPDGDALNVPRGVVVQIDAGATIKLQSANLDAGTTSLGTPRDGGAIQVLGTPGSQVILTAYGNDAIGGDSDGVTDGANAGDWGGVVYRADSDFQAVDAAINPGAPGIFLNYLNFADISFGGGEVPVDGDDQIYTPVHLVSARPTISNNTITNSAKAAISANPDSFDDSRGRIGPDIHGNLLSNNTTNGLIFRIDTEFGQPIDRLSVPARLDDTDIVHVITENLEIVGSPGGPLAKLDGTTEARLSGRLMVDPGVVVKLGSSRIESLRGNAHVIAEGTAEMPVIFTSILDDRYGAGGTFDTTGDGTDVNGDNVDDITGFDYAANGVASPVQPAAGDWGGLVFNAESRGSIDQAIISFGGGETVIPGGSGAFNAIEVLHRADVRVANSLIENNANGLGGTDPTRDNRGSHNAAVIFVRQSQPIILNNTFRNNQGSVIHINANALTSEFVEDVGRSTGAASSFPQFSDNQGPLVRLNRIEGNSINGMEIRGGTLSTESVWDDTDIVHVLRNEIIVNHHHTFSGLRLESSPSESLVVKLSGNNAGFTADGVLLDIEDRIGGTLQVIGQPLYPVILTSLSDDTIGASLQPDGFPQTDTDNSISTGSAGQWRGLRFTSSSNDANIRVLNERESSNNAGIELNGTTGAARVIRELAPDYKSGDENRTLGYELHGAISADDPGDVDIYSFRATAGSEVWFDLDRTSGSLAPVIELVELNAELDNARVNARAVFDDLNGVLNVSSPSGSLTQPATLGPLTKNTFDGGDFYSTNHRDAGFRAVLPGTPGSQRTYFVRVRSAQNTLADLDDISKLNDGLTSGEYQLQVRLQQVDQKAGSTVRFADIRYATDAIEALGLPFHSPLLSETQENGTGASQDVGNLLETDRNTISIGGDLSGGAGLDVDSYNFTVDYATTVFGPSIQSIGGVNDGGKSYATVFDLDYSDGLTRADATLIVSNGSGVPILIGRDSNIDADQPTGLPGDGNSTDDLTRGSAGVLDPFIGPVQLPAGTPGTTTDYTATVLSNARLVDQLDQTYQANATNQLVRLEPVNSIERIIEDHIGFEGYTSNGSIVTPTNENADNTTGKLFPSLSNANTLSTNQTYNSPSSGTALPTNIRPFDLSDVPLFVTTSDTLRTVNPYQGGVVNFIDSNLTDDFREVRDIVMRSDGFLYGYRNRRNNSGEAQGDANRVGELVRIDPATGVLTSVGFDNIPGRNQNVVTTANDFDDSTISDRVGAVTFDRNRGAGNAANYIAYYAVHENSTNTYPSGTFAPNSKLYRANATTGQAENGASDSGWGDIQLAGVTYAESSIRVRNNATPSVASDITVQARSPGADGNGITITLQYGTNNTLDVRVTGNTITVEIDDGNNAGAIASAINNDPEASRLVTAKVDINDGTGIVANGSVSGGGALTGGSGTPLRGFVTGLAFDSFYGDVGGSLHGITDAGELIRINTSNGSATMVYDLGLDGTLGGLDTRFTGLSLGPQNVSEFDALGNATPGRYAGLLFAVAQDGTLVAIDPATAALQTIFDTNNDGIADSNNIDVGVNNPTGLAFSPLDFNLWHPTERASSNNTGRGINATFDNTRTPADEDRTDGDSDITDGQGNGNYDQNESQGGTSLYFGLEEYTDNNTNEYYNYESTRGQLGVRNHDIQRDLTSNGTIGDNYNLPGGALGSLVTAPFDLVSQGGNEDTSDRPVLYFNYFLETEDQGDGSPSNNGSARDTARVYVTNDGGNSWTLVATNNGDGNGNSNSSRRDEDSELPTYSSHSRLADAGDGRQATQELFDNTGTWRQARIDLSDYVGDTGLMLRFDFSTSGSMNDSSLRTGSGDATDSYGEFFTETTDAQPSANNNNEGFYVDDLIVGWAERGEIITGANAANPSTVPTDPDPMAQGQILSGSYQLEIRRGYEFAAPPSAMESDLVINDSGIPDTNVQFVPGADLGLGAGLNVDFESVASVAGINFSRDSLNNPHWASTTLNASNAVGTHEDPSDLSQGIIGPQEQAEMIIVVTTGEGLLTFDRLFEPEVGHDTFSVFIDGTPIAAADFEFNGTDATAQLTQIAVSAGVHTVRFVHRKNASGTAGLGRLTIDNIQFPAIGGYLRGDRNIRREQGLFEIAGNIIRDSEEFGILVEPDTREAGSNNPRPGSPIRYETVNGQGLAPGAVIQNNIVVRSGSAGIRFVGGDAGSPGGARSVGKIINNTIVGGVAAGSDEGVQIAGSTNVTILNNIIANTTLAIDVSTAGGSPTAIIQKTHFYRNQNDGPTTGQNAIVVPASDTTTPLFIDAATDNYYLAFGALAIDRSQGSVPESTTFSSIKADLAIPPSDTFSPSRDLFGQLRQDDTTSPGPGSGGESFNDIGAVERADFIGPFATLVVPLDNGVFDQDPLVHDVTAVVSNFQPRFVVKLNTDGIGVNDQFVTASQWEVKQNGELLVEGVDYTFIYNTATDEVTFQAVTVFPTDHHYTITLTDRSAATGVRDLAGNAIQANRSNGDVRFEINLDNDVNDAPVNVHPSDVMLSEDSTPDDLIFSQANGNAISVSDPDVFLGNNELTVTLFADQGTLVLPTAMTTNVSGSVINFPDATNLVGRALSISDNRFPNDILTQRFTFVDAATSPTPSSTEIAINLTDTADAVATAVATRLDAFYGVATSTAAAGVLTFVPRFSAGRLVVQSSAIQVAGSDVMTVLDGATVMGEQFTVGIVTFLYVDVAVYDSSTLALTPKPNQIAVSTDPILGSAANVAQATANAISSTQLFGAGAATVGGSDVTLQTAGLYFSNTDGTSITVAGPEITLPDAATAISEELTLVGPMGRTYRFVDATTPSPAANDIPVSNTADDNAVAAALLQRIVADLGVGTARRSANRVILEAISGHTAEVVRPLILSGGTLTVFDGPTSVGTANTPGDHIAVGRTVFTYVDAAAVVTVSPTEIPIDLSMPGTSDTPEQVALQTVAVLNAFFGAGTASATGATGGGWGVTVSNVIVSGVTPMAGQRVVTLSGNVDMVNQALDGLTFVPEVDYFGPAAITVLTEDLGQFTTDPARQINMNDLDVISIDVKPVNDPPLIDAIGDQAIIEDQDLALPAGVDEQSVPFSGVFAGPINEFENMAITAQLRASTNVAVSNGLRVIGQNLVVEGVTFSIVDSAVVTTPTSTQIAVAQTDDTQTVATAIATTINAHRGDTVARTAFNFVSFDLDISHVTGNAAAFDIRDQDAIIANLAVDYVPTATGGVIRYTPAADAFGIVDVTVTLTDFGVNDIQGDSDDAVRNETFTVTIQPINDDPTLDVISDVDINEDPDVDTNGVNDVQQVALTGITPRPDNEMEDLAVTVSLADTTIIAFANGENVIGQTLTISGVDFEFVDVAAGAPTGNQIGVAQTDRTLDVVSQAVTVINIQFPGLATATQNSIALSVNDSMVSGGTVDSFTIFNQDDLIESTNVVYNSRDNSGTFEFTPARHHFGGPVNVTVTVTDAGLDGIAGNGDDQSTNEQFTITVQPVNDNPTVDPIGDVAVNEDDPETTVTITGVSAGPTVSGPNNELEDVRVDAVIEDTTSVAIAIGANVVGETISIGGEFFTYVDGAVAVTPTANQIAVDTTPATGAAQATQAIALATAAAANSHANLSPTAVSTFENTWTTALPVVTANTEVFAEMNSGDIINSLDVEYISRNLTNEGTIKFTPIGDAFGEVTITVTVEDAGIDGIFDDDLVNTLTDNEAADNNQVVLQFTVRVAPVNDLPTMDQITTQTTLEGSAEQSVALSGITAGPTNELEDIRLTSTLEATTTIVVATGEKVIGQGITVGAEAFSYVDAAVVGAPTANQIAVGQNDSSFEVALRTAAVVNNLLGVDAVIPWKNTINTAFAVILPPDTGVATTTVFSRMASNEIIGNLAIDYVSRAAAGTFRYTPVDADVFGVVTVTITTEDAGVDGVFGNSDDLSIDRQFTIIVDPVNDVPTLDAINPVVLTEDPDADMNGANDEQSVSLTGIHPQPGITVTPGNELEDLRVSAVLQDTTIVAVAWGDTIIGETLTVSGTAFDFVDAAGAAPVGNQIAVNRTDSTQAVATAAAAVINTAALAGITATATENSVALTVDSASVTGSDLVDAFAIRNQNDLITNLAVVYNSRETTGTIRFTPGEHQFGGPITVTVTTLDAGVDGLFEDNLSTVRDESADNLTTLRQFTITLNPDNDNPEMDAVSSQSTQEDAVSQNVGLTGIYAGPQRTGVNDRNELEDIAVTYRLHDSTTVVMSIGQHVIGESVTIGGTQFDFVDAASTPTPTSTQIAVNATDATQIVAAAAATVINAQLGANAVSWTDNTINTELSATVSSTTVFATMNQDDIVQNLGINYTSRDTTGTFSYTPGADAFGQVTVTITVADAGVDGIFTDDPLTGVDEAADNLSIDRTFTITVEPDNDTPQTNPIGGQSVNEDGVEQSVAISGVTPRPDNELEDIQITFALEDTTTVVFAYGSNIVGETLIVDGVTFTYVDAATTLPGADDIAVNLQDRTQTIAQKTAVAINARLAAIVAVASDNTITVPTSRNVVVPAASDRYALMNSSEIVENLAVDYISRDTTGTFRYTPVADAFGLVRVTLTTLDAGVDGIFVDDPGTIVDESLDNLFVQTPFTISVLPVNDQPTMDVVPTQTTSEEDVQQTVSLTGIDTRLNDTNELEDILITHTLHDTVSIAFAIGANMFGEQITINGQAFTYVDSAVVALPGATQIAVAATDSTQTVAAQTASVINAFSGVAVATLSDNTITVDAATNPTGTPGDSFFMMSASDIVNNLQVVYTSRDATGSFLYTPSVDNFGLVTVTLNTLDAGVDGEFGNFDDLSIDRTFNIAVTALNDTPGLAAISNETVNEDDPEQSVGLTGIEPGHPNELEDLQVSFQLGNTSSVAFARGGNLFGESITVGGTSFTFVDSATTIASNVQIGVTEAELTQNVAILAAAAINAELGAGTVVAQDNFITTAQTVAVSSTNRMAVMADSAIIAGLAIDYVSRDTTGTFRYTPVGDAFGQVTVNVTVLDAGVDGLFSTTADNLSTTQSFVITVTPDNDLPAMDAVPAQTTDEDSVEQSVSLSGILPTPANELEDIRVTPVLNDTTSVAFAYGANLIGESITIIGVQFDFVDMASTPTPTATQIVITPLDTTQTIAVKAASTINGQMGANTVSASNNTITMSTSLNPVGSSADKFASMTAAEIVQSVAVDYNSRDTTGTLRYTPSTNAFGQVNVTLTTLDAGVDGRFATADDLSITRDVLITITPLNDQPTLDSISDQTVGEDSGLQAISLSGISTGVDNELEDIQLSHTLHATTSVAIAVGANVIGESLTVNGTLFTFVDATIVTTPALTQIAVNTTDSTQSVATEAARVIDAALGGGNQVVATDNTITTAQPVIASSTDVFAVMDSSAIVQGLSFNYTSRDATGTLEYTPVANNFGTVTVTVTATDAGVDGQAGTADDLFVSDTFTITVTPDNDVPTIGVVAPQSVGEDAAEQSITITGITVGPGNELEDLQLTASLNSTNTLIIAAGANVIGKTVTINGIAFEYVDSAVVTSPTATQIAVALTDTTQTVAAQTATVSNARLGGTPVAASDNTINTALPISASSTQNFSLTTASAIISGLAVDYNSRDATATVRYTPVANAFGQVVVTLQATDAGVDGNFDGSGDLSVFRDIVISVVPDNDAPTLSVVGDQTVEDSAEQSIALTGITAGQPNELEDIALTHRLHDTTTLAISANVIGEIISIDGVDFTYVDSAVTTAPSTAEIAVAADATTQEIAAATADAVNLRLGAGSVLASQNTINTELSVVPGSAAAFTVTTSTNLISGLVIDYNSRDTTGALRYTAIGNAYGVATVTVTATDAGVDGVFGILGDSSIDRTFTITVLPVNDAPTIDAVSDVSLQEDDSTQSVDLTGITPGAGELEAVRISATIDDTTVLVMPSGGDATGKTIAVGGEVFTYVTTSTGDDHEILIIDVTTQVTVDSTSEVAEATALTLNAFFGAGSATATGNTVSTALPVGALASPFIGIPANQIIGQPVVSYTTGATTGTLGFTPLTNAFGAVTISLTLEDAGIDGIFDTSDDATTIQKVNVFVQPVNDLPAYDVLSDVLLPVDAGTQTIDITGIINGPANELEALRVTVTSSDTNFIPTPIIQYISPQNVGTLTFTPAAGLSGAATITVTLEDAGVDGVFEDSVTPQLEQADNLSVVRTFRVTTPPIILSPNGSITDTTPLLSWTAIPGTSAYRVELINVTDGVAVDLGTGLVATNSLQLTTPLDLAAYTLRIQAIDGFNVPGLWSEVTNFTVASAPTVLAPSSPRLPDSTPTFSWTPVSGADSYEIEVVDDITGEIVFAQTGLTGTTITVPDEMAIALGRYRYTITAVNSPADVSEAPVRAAVTAIVTISTPPEILTPFVAIYDVTPTITWTDIPGAVKHELEVFNVSTNSVEFTIGDIVGTEYTVPGVDQLAVGEYQARVRAFGDESETIVSDYSTVHVFLVGTSPTLLGPSGGVGTAPFGKTVDDQPTFRWEGALDGETYTIWWNSVTEGTNLYIVDGIEETSFTPPDKLAIGRYRVWVRATTGTGEQSAWSRSYDFEVVTPPVIDSFGTSTFNNQPTITWNAQERVDRWQVWVNDVGNNNPVVLYNLTDPADQVTTNSFTFPDVVEDGRYRVWVRGFATNETTGEVTTTQWSSVYQFDIGGRPTLNAPESTTDTTPTVSWSVVEDAASYEIYLAEASDIGSPLVREAGISGNSYTFNQLPEGEYRVWVRARSVDGRLTPWSLSSESFMTISSTVTQPLTAPVLNAVSLNGNLPTFSWSSVSSAVRYEIYVAPNADSGTPVIRVDNVVGTSYTANAGLASNDYRVWVRSIGASGKVSGWSTPQSFSIVALDGQATASDAPDVMLTKLSVHDVAALINDQFAVSQTADGVVTTQPALVSSGVEGASEQPEAASVVDSAELVSGDDLMAGWDDAIWEEESAAFVAVAEPSRTAAVENDQPTTAGWMAGLAAFTPSLFRRRRNKKQ